MILLTGTYWNNKIILVNIYLTLIVTDLLFLEGMEAIFRIALVLLRNHEEALLACDSFEQIMDYMKTTMPNVQLSQQGYIISQVFPSLYSVRY